MEYVQQQRDTDCVEGGDLDTLFNPRRVYMLYARDVLHQKKAENAG